VVGRPATTPYAPLGPCNAPQGNLRRSAFAGFLWASATNGVYRSGAMAGSIARDTQTAPPAPRAGRPLRRRPTAWAAAWGGGSPGRRQIESCGGRGVGEKSAKLQPSRPQPVTCQSPAVSHRPIPLQSPLEVHGGGSFLRRLGTIGFGRSAHVWRGEFALHWVQSTAFLFCFWSIDCPQLYNYRIQLRDVSRP